MINYDLGPPLILSTSSSSFSSHFSVLLSWQHAQIKRSHWKRIRPPPPRRNRLLQPPPFEVREWVAWECCSLSVCPGPSMLVESATEQWLPGWESSPLHIRYSGGDLTGIHLALYLSIVQQTTCGLEMSGQARLGTGCHPCGKFSRINGRGLTRV